MARLLTLAFGLALLFVAATNPASANFRIFEEAADDPEAHRYLDLGFYVQPSFVWRENPNLGALDVGVNEADQFVLRRARVNLRAQPYRWMRLETSFELSEGTPRDAFVEFRYDRRLFVRLGQQRIPLALDYLRGQAQMSLIDRPIYLDDGEPRGALYFVDDRDVGASVGGRFGGENQSDFALDYQALVANGEGINSLERADSAFLYAARLQAHLLGPASTDSTHDLAREIMPKAAVGLGGMVNCTARASFVRAVAADAEFRYQGLYVNMTVLWSRFGPSSDLGDAIGYGGACGDNSGARNGVGLGGSVQAQYMLPTMLFPVHGQALELLVRGDFVDANSPADGLLGGDQNSAGYVAPSSLTSEENAAGQWRLTLGATWFPTAQPNLRLSVNYQLKRETEDLRVSDGVISSVSNDMLVVQLTAGL